MKKFLLLSSLLISIILISACSSKTPADQPADVEDPTATAPAIDEGADINDLNMENALKELDLVE